jgi:hypothetical protein
VLRDDVLVSEPAGVREDRRFIAVDVLVELDAATVAPDAGWWDLTVSVSGT